VRWGDLKRGDVVAYTAYGAPLLVVESIPGAKPLMYVRLFNLETGRFESHGALADLSSSWFMIHEAAS